MDIQLPLGFTMSLAQNERAMQRFEQMSREEKLTVIERSRAASSKREMRSLVDRLAQGNF